MEKFKKLLSIALSVCIFTGLATSAAAESKMNISDGSVKNWSFNETVILEGKVITYTHYTIDNIRYTEFLSHGQKTVIAFDSNTNAIYINDNFCATTDIQNKENNFLSEFSLRYNWKKYDFKTGSVGGLFGDIETIAGIIASVTQNPVAYCIQVASGLIQLGTSSITYNKHFYYWDPVTTSRPITATCTYFWSGGTLLGTIDNR